MKCGKWFGWCFYINKIWFWVMHFHLVDAMLKEILKKRENSSCPESSFSGLKLFLRLPSGPWTSWNVSESHLEHFIWPNNFSIWTIFSSKIQFFSSQFWNWMNFLAFFLKNQNLKDYFTFNSDLTKSTNFNFDNACDTANESSYINFSEYNNFKILCWIADIRHIKEISTKFINFEKIQDFEVLKFGFVTA